MSRHAFLSILIALLVLRAGPAAAATRQVSTTGTDWANDCIAKPCATIRHALQASASGDTILIGPGSFVEAESIVVSKDLTLRGAAPSSVSVDPPSTKAIIVVTSKTKVTIDGLDIWGGQAGGVSNSGKLTVQNSRVHNNQNQIGGGIYNNPDAALWMEHVLIEDNTAAKYAGGIFNSNDAVTVAIDVIVQGNLGEGGRGGIANFGVMLMHQSLITENVGGFEGGGIFTNGAMLITRSTITKNNASGGPGGGIITAGGTTILQHVTIADNNAFMVGGLAVNVGAVTLRNTIIANNAGDQCRLLPSQTPPATLDALGSLSSDQSCPSWPFPYNLPSTDPLLGTLGDYGGNSDTIPIGPGSAAIDAGNKLFCLPDDQRGFPSPIDGDLDGLAKCDIGAYEYQLEVGGGGPADNQRRRWQNWRRQGPSKPTGSPGRREPRGGGF